MAAWGSAVMRSWACHSVVATQWPVTAAALRRRDDLVVLGTGEGVESMFKTFARQLESDAGRRSRDNRWLPLVFGSHDHLLTIPHANRMPASHRESPAHAIT